ncbi:GGDEF domain-containing protein [Actinoplanes couchii]|uniref:GGDEF domain-containing protein n=1 Tax=Actinoplanes couchii TaxID=403638 RepID=A0ABQ3XDE1_9ACTN|nr:GGDEF domain-containing protein [Actinoplanes couchii]GID56491.1 hypothetical protein Aco03nite_048950 [Actinoplanes couchii]
MRDVIRRPTPAPAPSSTLSSAPSSAPDDALLARRRTIETAGLVSRGLGIVATMLSAVGIGGGSVAVTTDHMRSACWAGVALMLLANVFSALNRREPDSPRFRWRSVAQVTLDTVTVGGMVIISTLETDVTIWPVLAVSIALAALRLQLSGALATFGVVTVAYTYFVPYDQDWFFVVGVNLLIAVIAGAQSSSLDRHLTELDRTRRKLQHQATHDSMTGLPNRARLAVYADGCADRPLAVILLDLNGFKQVNDVYGHAAGDMLLHTIAGRLTGVLDREGLAGRLGGDEFMVLLPDADDAVVARTVTRIRDAVRQPVGIGDGRTVRVGASVGVALRAAGADAGLDALTAEADAGMYQEKRARASA